MKTINYVFRTVFLWAVFLCLSGLPVIAGEDRVEQEVQLQNGKLRVVCTTTVLSSVVEAVGAESVDVHTVIPYGMCPGHFDLTPGESQKLLESDLLLYHGYEPFLRGIDPGKRTNVVNVGIEGNWMIPDIYLQGVWKVADILAAERPAKTEIFSVRAQEYAGLVRKMSDALRNDLADLASIPVVCSGMNRDLAEWLGLRVIADFPRDEDISVKTLHAIVVEGQKQTAKLVIDNRQSSGKVGRTIADELNIPLVVLTNFPAPDAENHSGYSYTHTLSDNCAALSGALKGDHRDNQ